MPSIRANLRFHGRLFGLSGRRLDDRIAELGQRFGLTEMLGRPVRTLSGGQQRRVEIARALIAAPDLLIMDEPSAGLDATSRIELVAHIRALAREQGVAVLWATHLVDEVEAADRVIVLMGGRVVADSAPSVLLSQTGAPDLGGAYRSLTISIGRPAPEPISFPASGA